MPLFLFCSALHTPLFYIPLANLHVDSVCTIMCKSTIRLFLDRIRLCGITAVVDVLTARKRKLCAVTLTDVVKIQHCLS